MSRLSRPRYQRRKTRGFTTRDVGDEIRRVVSRWQYRRELATGVSTKFNGVTIDSYSYSYDALSRPTTRNSDAFGYNERGEVVFSRRDAESAEDSYEYDGIGNLQIAAFNFVTNTYTANNLNQYTSILRVSAPLREISHDLDGNMTSDNIFAYSYDAANRLSTVSSNGIVLVAYQYDYRGRRMRKTTPTTETTFVYDGWNLIHETVSTISGTITNVTEIQYFWGSDLSGTLQGAGGVGGLLAVSLNGLFYFPAFDNNGNVTKYIDESGTIVAAYEYNAFGKTISQSGSLADTFRHRFSTKYFDSEISLYYYGYRFYSPMLMRWLNRDPIEEEGGVNLHQFCKNGFDFDALGLTSVSISMRKEFMEGKLGESEFLCVEVTIIEPPQGDGHLNFIQLKNPGGRGWSVDYSRRLGPYYYNREELNRYSSFDAKGRKVITLYDSPGGAMSEDVLFYVAVVEVGRKCKAGKWGAIKCYDKVKLVDSRTWTYHHSSNERYTYRNMSAGQGMLPTLKELVNKSTWKTELCSTTEVDVQ